MTAGLTFFNTVSRSSTRLVHVEARGAFRQERADVVLEVRADVRVRTVHLGDHGGRLSVHLCQARVEVAHVEGAVGRDAAQPRHGDAVDQPDASLEVIHLSDVVETGLIISRTRVPRRNRDDRRVPIGVHAEGRNLGVIRVWRQHQQRARQIETVREQPQWRSARGNAHALGAEADARACGDRSRAEN